MFNKTHGIEVLLRKASVDSGFRDLLLRRRGKAAEEIGLNLTPAEQSILATIPEADLVRMLSKIEVPEVQRTVFMGKTAAAMIAIVVGAGILSGCGPVCTGIRPREEAGEDQVEPAEPDEQEEPAPTRGIRPDRVEPREAPGDGK